MRCGSADAPKPAVISKLLYDEDLYTRSGTITEARLALLRDLNERKILADLAENAEPPVVSFTDGQMELWGARDGSTEATEFQKSLNEYLAALERLSRLGVVTAGYVDKPGANLVVRLLEVATLSQAELADIRDHQPLRGVSDLALFRGLLRAGERSAVFALQSQSAAASYRGQLALHFFYLNVGQPGRPRSGYDQELNMVSRPRSGYDREINMDSGQQLARVEIPAWVAGNPEMLELLHSVLVDQCRTIGARAYPYLLHRAHETAVVTLPEKDQVSQLIAVELLRRGVEVEDLSQKQALKDLGGRTRHKL
jgi:hypothetical protein